MQCGKPRFDPWVGKICWRRKWQPTPVLLPGISHGRRSLIGYSPWGHGVAKSRTRLKDFSFFVLFFRRSVVSESFATPQTLTRQAPLSMEFPRQEYWSGLPFPPPEESSGPRDRTESPALANRFFTTEPPGKLHTPLLDANMAFTLPRGGVTFWYIPSTKDEATWNFLSFGKLYGIKLLHSKKM